MFVMWKFSLFSWFLEDYQKRACLIVFLFPFRIEICGWIEPKPFGSSVAILLVEIVGSPRITALSFFVSHLKSMDLIFLPEGKIGAFDAKIVFGNPKFSFSNRPSSVLPIDSQCVRSSVVLACINDDGSIFFEDESEISPSSVSGGSVAFGGTARNKRRPGGSLVFLVPPAASSEEDSLPSPPIPRGGKGWGGVGPERLGSMGVVFP
ncbi:hypothetical protein TNIN_172201 [Trichonephila inaurata madagascariensis]|uniref:Uncharacterized protein n=1 Tax=Trichonephila inaurata madagascariensis TaxID=2747483 RepID=A0A8X6WUX2_9ARAC|nr:hypothetical protein TNIN_172201 [Trichonephila inaurata madagascariensis]